jgi:hypothetical protein
MDPTTFEAKRILRLIPLIALLLPTGLLAWLLPRAPAGAWWIVLLLAVGFAGPVWWQLSGWHGGWRLRRSR